MGISEPCPGKRSFDGTAARDDSKGVYRYSVNECLACKNARIGLIPLQLGAASSSGSPAGHGDRRQTPGRGAPLVRQDAFRAQGTGLLGQPSRLRRSCRGRRVGRLPGTRARALPGRVERPASSCPAIGLRERRRLFEEELRLLYKALDRASEWTTLLGSIRDKYCNRPRFMELLDGVEGRTIVQSTRSRRK